VIPGLPRPLVKICDFGYSKHDNRSVARSKVVSTAGGSSSTGSSSSNIYTVSAIQEHMQLQRLQMQQQQQSVKLHAEQQSLRAGLNLLHL
jgi:hypothetical protein